MLCCKSASKRLQQQEEQEEKEYLELLESERWFRQEAYKAILQARDELRAAPVPDPSEVLRYQTKGYNMCRLIERSQKLKKDPDSLEFLRSFERGKI
mmetsp:Transcript_22259/g.38214  ORF Transcript_22259/g.38214 Transcript_22259/m.38214 type:complete len:97 (+) Transcript_22259:413-703(+)|eukprot:CAMPEP_0196657732 /NCGR_PEP_ID=MMETSP1086-20130531/25211_1 /TAXON_ID=77921 /ORGANISM="Cyanoptyche  gloeocystis , Strain SAG4.97" /LENGTH=96 /DNA_ID=CAMNT_0041990977 /DNA_START=455 /DNA_END=745 /DNA_ORIENTATION=+